MIGQSLADPGGANALLGAVAWLQGTLLGTVAQIVAIIAVASIGLMMMSGRVNVRHGATVILGCFVIFGASTIAAGLRAISDGSGSPAVSESVTGPTQQAVPTPPHRDQAYDPYAGASLIR